MHRNSLNMAKEDKEKEVIEQLKQISSKLDALNNKEETENFQLDMLKVQVKQNNIVMLLTVVVSITVSFFISLVTVALTTNIPKEIFTIVGLAIGFEILVLIVVFCVIWIILNHLMLNKIDKLRPKK